MVNKNSIYSLNKNNPDAIVYPSTTGKPVFVTRDDFPSEEEFLAFKKWSDENFHEEEKLDQEKRVLEEQAKLDRLNNPTTEDLLKDILEVLKEKK